MGAGGIYRPLAPGAAPGEETHRHEPRHRARPGEHTIVTSVRIRTPEGPFDAAMTAPSPFSKGSAKPAGSKWTGDSG